MHQSTAANKNTKNAVRNRALNVAHEHMLKTGRPKHATAVSFLLRHYRGVRHLNATPKIKISAPVQDALRQGLTDAITRGQHHRAEDILLRFPMLINTPDTRMELTPLHLAVTALDEHMLQWLLERGADVEARDRDGRTPLLRLLALSRTDGRKKFVVAKTLLRRYRANPRATDNAGDGSLHAIVNTVADDWHVQDAKRYMLLLALYGANVNAKNTTGVTPLHLAMRGMPDFAIASTLIDMGADINATDDAGRRPLSYLVSHMGHVPNALELDFAKLLIERGATAYPRDPRHESLRRYIREKYWNHPLYVYLVQKFQSERNARSVRNSTKRQRTQ